MFYDYAITFLNCQSCTAKIHCEQCGAELRERLLGRGCAESAAVDIPNRRMSVSTAMDEDDLLDLLEEMGVFAD